MLYTINSQSARSDDSNESKHAQVRGVACDAVVIAKSSQAEHYWRRCESAMEAVPREGAAVARRGLIHNGDASVNSRSLNRLRFEVLTAVPRRRSMRSNLQPSTSSPVPPSTSSPLPLRHRCRPPRLHRSPTLRDAINANDDQSALVFRVCLRRVGPASSLLRPLPPTHPVQSAIARDQGRRDRVAQRDCCLPSTVDNKRQSTLNR